MFGAGTGLLKEVSHLNFFKEAKLFHFSTGSTPLLRPRRSHAEEHRRRSTAIRNDQVRPWTSW